MDRPPLILGNSLTRLHFTMAVGLLTLELYLPLNDSLKGKRGILKPLIARLATGIQRVCL